MNNPVCPRARQNGLVVQEMPGEVLIYDTKSNKAHCLNETAAAVWRSCTGSNSVSEIARGIGNGETAQVTEDFVWLALDQLNETGLLETGTALRFAGQPRREVLKKIGLVSVMALPIIASLVAPQHALSAVSCHCASLADCVLQPMCSMTTCTPAGVCT